MMKTNGGQKLFAAFKICYTVGPTEKCCIINSLYVEFNFTKNKLYNS